ncbi:NtaA/DmoA family FMN-dependent monooxygenase [Subtercola endophyticus]|uniref:NtaA/DmoA family FMN-dependent monooxygenase n=1 Tax=Subtercola endophyticus TaxID=2895559 RepID=UPI001E4FF7B5|nr:NtaA/DmoA family FMN-dependent monooxygenase [Subtercola endophyticus]UFS58619.1 NtaA/DmoA family FMN-dependent monooxygenase [Subtercola endophyticus]
MNAKRQIHVSLLTMPTLAHNDYGLWAHPESQKHRFREVSFWQELGRICEEAKMDALFFADGLGIADSYTGSIEVSLREGMHVPVLDPLLVAAAAMTATTNLGWATTISTTFEPPFGHARRMATMDHITDGRAGWNVVMSFLKNAEENFGVDAGLSRDRYNRSEDFMEVCYKLWESSWDDDAVIADRESQEYIDPSKVRRIDHVGEHYSSSGPALWDPSIQRTPVIFQAGMSTRGREFAGKHAEVSFMINREDDAFRASIADLRAKAAGFGRGRDDLKVLAYCGIIVGKTEEEARQKLAEFEKFTKVDGYLAHENALNGFDPLKHPRDKLVIDALAEDGLREETATYARGPEWTIGDLLDHVKDLAAEKMVAVGDPVHVADLLEQWMDEFDLDGFLLRSFLYPGSATDFRDLVVPELQRRGRYRTEYEGTTLRENIFGAGHTRIAESHPAAAYKAVTV